MCVKDGCDSSETLCLLVCALRPAKLTYRVAHRWPAFCYISYQDPALLAGQALVGSLREPDVLFSFFWCKELKSTAIDTEAAGEGMDPPLPPSALEDKSIHTGCPEARIAATQRRAALGSYLSPRSPPTVPRVGRLVPAVWGAACRMQSTMRFRLGFPSHSRRFGVWCGAGRTRGQHESPCWIARVQLHTTRR